MLDRHQQPGELVLELTYPPSVNHYYVEWAEYSQKAGKYIVRKAIGKAGMAYRAECRRFKLQDLRNPRILTCRLSCEIETWRPNRRKVGYDIDNFLKCLFDAMEYAQVMENDEQIDALVVYKRGVEAPGRIKVTLREI